LFRKVVKLCPEMSVMFVSSLVRACFANISAMSFADVEVSLYLLGLLSDASTQVGTVLPLSSSVVSSSRTEPFLLACGACVRACVCVALQILAFSLRCWWHLFPQVSTTSPG
jgi:hypothetical protein